MKHRDYLFSLLIHYGHWHAEKRGRYAGMSKHLTERSA